ncbi:Ubiquitin-conjugating enzyme E2 (E3-independent) [Giardia muris]|uniref:Ubiquitin-conjugating enzyme E2 (E3-independent) n=1 Tax=Giardia muris TaxID=5742 RepID=A0A4Z1SUZ2_GIAMU|nr:Ubiquitin-conjugating enzyme E2 (E3-independent) [Giardia muris]|eukprot:TNJ29500.1 Ubiquitin-conjugating enzyme E2 (E3-independent) [Giardia muris]
MASISQRRLFLDYQTLVESPPDNIIASPYKDDIYTWAAIIIGPADTPWDGAIIKIHLRFTIEYPNKPPTLRVLTRLFHPNIYNDGRICLDLLADKWSPALGVSSILLSVQSLLTDPNPLSPANSEAATLYVNDRHAYNLRVSACARQSWEEAVEPPYSDLLHEVLDEAEGDDEEGKKT